MVQMTGVSDWTGCGSSSTTRGRSPTPGIMLPAMLASRLGIEALVEETVDLGGRAGAGNPGAKVMTLLSAMALGADC